MNILFNSSKEKKDIVKATTASEALKDHVGKHVTVKNIISYQKDEEADTIFAVETEEAGWLYTNSPTVKNVLESVIAGYEKEEINAGVPVRILTQKSKAGRDFYLIELL